MRLLIIEDEPDLLRALSRALREDGYAVDTAEDGEDGCYKALENEYDAIVLDWMLPQMNGLALLTALRKQKRTPVIMLTARGAVNHRIEGLRAGADDYLAKPFDINELRARLQALIRRSAGLAHDQIVIGPVKVDTWGKTVTLSGEPIVLTAREYALVEYLALRRGKVVSRTELFEHLFDENEDSLSNLLDVRVSLVRKSWGLNLSTPVAATATALHENPRPQYPLPHPALAWNDAGMHFNRLWGDRTSSSLGERTNAAR